MGVYVQSTVNDVLVILSSQDSASWVILVWRVNAYFIGFNTRASLGAYYWMKVCYQWIVHQGEFASLSLCIASRGQQD